MEKNDKEILMSIIVPVYNGEKYIRECIDSILSSSLKNYELIIVDDGSTDKTRDIVNNYLNINNLAGGGIFDHATKSRCKCCSK